MRLSHTHASGVGILVGLALSGAACTGGPPQAPPPTSASPAGAPAAERVVGPLSPEDAKALATMNDRIKAYIELHRQIERTLPKLPKEASPDQIDLNQRAFENLIREKRADAKPGEIFTPEARPVIKRL